MDMKEVLTDRAPAPVGPYSQAIVAGGMVYCSAQIAIDPATNHLVDGGIGEEIGRVMKNLSSMLAAAGSSMEKVVKTTVYLRDMNDFNEMNESYAAWFPGMKPARAAVAVTALPKDAGVAIDCIAVV